MANQLKNWLKRLAEPICKKLEKSILSDRSLKCKVVYGPIRSRRLGLVLGVNNVKPNVCSYNCIYCPVGKTSCCSLCTNNCLSPYELFVSVKNKMEEINKIGKKIDYILFSGSGDPAVDTGLSKEISILREFDYKIAVYTNAASLWNENIQENLLCADYVSIKIDTVNENTWLRMNRPHQRLNYDLILNGIKQFSKRFRGTLTTETTLIKNFNDSKEEVEDLCKFLNKIQCQASYFMTPIYPPQESFALNPSAETLKYLFGIIQEKVKNSVMLCCPKTEEFIATDDFENELLGLLEMHPITEEAVTSFAEANNKIQYLNSLLENNIIESNHFNGIKYFTLVNSLQPQVVK